MSPRLNSRNTSQPLSPTKSARGQALIEFALLFPFIALFLFIIIDFGIALDRKVIFTNAAREAARYASLGQDTNADSIAQIAVNHSQGAFTVSDVNVYWVDANGDNQVRAGEPVVVHIQYTYSLPILQGMLDVFNMSTPELDIGACTDMALVQDVSGVPISSPDTVPCGGT
jgi:hypothetical protein